MLFSGRSMDDELEPFSMGGQWMHIRPGTSTGVIVSSLMRRCLEYLAETPARTDVSYGADWLTGPTDLTDPSRDPTKNTYDRGPHFPRYLQGPGFASSPFLSRTVQVIHVCSPFLCLFLWRLQLERPRRQAEVEEILTC